MKRKFCRMSFKTTDGVVVPELSKEQCVPEQVMAALHFLDSGYVLELSIHEVEQEKD